VIGDLAEHAATTKAGLILLHVDTRFWAPAPSARLLALMHSALPWTTSLSAQSAGGQARPPHLDPVLTRAARHSEIC
jgi:hypothetical protein